jgi:hypothetical protein
MASFAQSVKRKVVDAETGSAVPFVTVVGSDKAIGAYADVDGIFSIELKDGLTYTFSQLGYKQLTVSFQQLSSEKAIRMEALPLELNPVIIRADDALRTIYRATDSTHKRMPITPFYRRCYREEILQKNREIVERARAILDIEISRIYSPGKGAFDPKRLKGLNLSIYGDTVRTRPKMVVPICFTNQFLVGVKPKQEKDIIFTRMIEDSNILISYYPKPNYPGKGIYTSGRFVVDKNNMTIRRIDQFLDDNALIRYNNDSEEYLFHEYNIRFYFAGDGIVSKIESVLRYSMKDKPKEIFTWTTTHIYKESTELEYQKKPSVRYNQRKFILQQRPVDMLDFDRVFREGFGE